MTSTYLATGLLFPTRMRALIVAMLFAGCTDVVLDEDATYRRLRDQFTSYDQCLAEGDFTPCYQTLALCANGRARIDLENSPQRGTYQLADHVAIASFSTMGTIDFDLERLGSADLPGRHAWQQIDPTVQSCD
jgi:hypothetical protein